MWLVLRVTRAPRERFVAGVWTWACLLDPLLLAAIVGLTLGSAADSLPVGVLGGLAPLLLLYWQRNYGPFAARRRRRYRG